MDLKQAAAIAGREGGKKKVPKGFAKMNTQRLKKISKDAIAKRWSKERGE